MTATAAQLQLEALLVDIVADVQRLHPRMPLQAIRDLLLAGEPDTAFQNLCDSLYVDDLGVSPVVLDKMAVVGHCMGMESSCWMTLRAQ